MDAKSLLFVGLGLVLVLYAVAIVRGGIGRYYGNVLLNIPMNEVRNRNQAVSITVLNPSLTNPLQGLTFDQLLFNRPLPGYAQYRAPVGGMYLCGSSTHPGGGVMGAPGANAARR